jgi:putative hydrolase of the HAD superfamily
MIQFVLFDAVGTILFPSEPIEVTYSKLFAQFGIHATASVVKAQFRAAFQHAFEFKPAENAQDLWSPDAQEQIDALEPAHQHALSRCYPTDESDQRKRWQSVVQFCVASVATDVSVDVSEQIFSMLWEHFAKPHAWTCEPSFAELVKLLQQRKIRWAIGSNFDSRLRQVVTGHRELDTCCAVFDSATVGFEKPDPRFYAAVEQAAKTAKKEMLMVGDDEIRDFLAPRLFGWNACLINHNQALINLVLKMLNDYTDSDS